MATHAANWGDEPTQDDKTFALLAHLSVYLAPVIGPVILYVLFKDSARSVAYHAVQALAASLACGAVAVAATVMITVISVVTCGIGSILYLGLLPLALVPLYGAYQAYSARWDGFPMLSQFGR